MDEAYYYGVEVLNLRRKVLWAGSHNNVLIKDINHPSLGSLHYSFLQRSLGALPSEVAAEKDSLHRSRRVIVC